MTYLAVEALRQHSPRGWDWLPLRRVCRIRRDRNRGSQAQLLALASEEGVRPRAADGGRQLPSEGTIEDYWLVRAGDLVFNPMWAIGRGVAVSDFDGAVSTAYRVYEPGPRLHPRFLHHYMRCDPLVEQYSLVVRGLTTFDRSVTRDDLDSLPVPLPPLTVQRAIADYLDTETARIDALIAKKQVMTALLDLRRSALIESEIRSLAMEWGERRLRFVAPDILVGIVITPAAYYASSGVLALRGLNVKAGRLDLTEVVTISEEGHALHGKSALHAGDLVVVRTGQAGAACVVPPELEGTNCIDLLIVRQSASLDPEFLEYVINSDWTAKHIEEHSVGTIQSHFNVGALKELPVPVPPVDVQRATAARLTQAISELDSIQATLNRQIGLLIEHRQALITAAVTGELSVPGMAA